MVEKPPGDYHAMTPIQERLAEILTKLGLQPPTELVQTLLMKDGYFAGYKYRYDDGFAILNGDTIEVFDADGQSLTKAPLCVVQEGAA